MQDISVGLVSSLPVIVVGPIGSGKSHLIHLIASLTRNRLISYQLSCETDAACLIGGYVQKSDGQFEWRAGPLAHAAQAGNWILLEDIDQAGGDCFPLVAQLVERNVLSVAGHGRPIIPHPNFRLILTQRTSESGAKTNSLVSSLYTKCHFVQLANHNTESLREIVSAHFPELPKVIQKIPVEILRCLQSMERHQSRTLGVRECVTFAARLDKHNKGLSPKSFYKTFNFTYSFFIGF